MLTWCETAVQLDKGAMSPGSGQGGKSQLFVKGKLVLQPLVFRSAYASVNLQCRLCSLIYELIAEERKR